MNSTNTQPEQKTLEIRARVNRILQLSALPGNVMKIIQTLNNANSTAADVGADIAKDPAFSAQVLKLVNSGFYGFSTPVMSIGHATVLLGFTVMKSLVMSASVLGAITPEMEGLWKHSMACARASVFLARKLGIDEPEELSTAGLLHDIGKIVLAQYLNDDFHLVCKAVESRDLLFIEAEREILGITHVDLARWLFEKWKLPPQTKTPITEHHAIVPEADFVIQTSIVHLADIMIRAEGIGSGGDTRMPLLSHAAMDILKITPGQLKGIMDEMVVELNDLF